MVDGNFIIKKERDSMVIMKWPKTMPKCFNKTSKRVNQLKTIKKDRSKHAS